MNAWYSLAKAKGLGGQGTDELTTNLVQDSTNPYADVQWGPSRRTDARHQITFSAVVNMKWGIYVSPTFRYRSALPLHISTAMTSTPMAQQRHLLDGVPVHGHRRSGQPDLQGHRRLQDGQLRARRRLSQFNLRVSKVFRLPYGMNVEAIGEVFNLFNAINPNYGAGVPAAGAFFTGTRPTIRRTLCS